MKTFDSEIKKYADKIHLKASERRELRDRIFAYMEYHPLPKAAEAPAKGYILSESFSIWNFNTWQVRAIGGMFALLLIIVPFVAERSVPGDVLYRVKTNVNESFQSQLATSPYEKIEFETRLMEKRIAEARVLANEGRLTDEVKTQIAETVKGHSMAVQEGIAELRTQDAEGAAIAQIAYSSSLEVQSAMLAKDDGDAAVARMDTGMAADSMMMMAKSAAPVEVDPILSVVNEARDVIANEQGGTYQSFDSLMASTERETTRAYELFEEVKETATAEEIRDIERRLSDVNRLIEESKQKRVEDEFIASMDLTNTLKQLQKLVLFMTDINVRETVALETIVPVVLSDAERLEIVRAEYAALEAARAALGLQIDQVTDPEVIEKIEEGLTIINELMDTASSTLDTAPVEELEQTIGQVRMWVVDLQVLIEVTLTPTQEEPIPEVVPEPEVAPTSSTTEIVPEPSAEAPVE